MEETEDVSVCAADNDAATDEAAGLRDTVLVAVLVRVRVEVGVVVCVTPERVAVAVPVGVVDRVGVAVAVLDMVAERELVGVSDAWSARGAAGPPQTHTETAAKSTVRRRICETPIFAAAA